MSGKRQYLAFQIYGPMASWGDLAVGELRLSHDSPSKSALVGLLAAALGATRDQSDIHQSLANDFHYATKMMGKPHILSDFHTVQAPQQRKKQSFQTRQEALSAPTINTLVSTREYRTETTYLVTVWTHTKSPAFALSQLCDALDKPVFTLYLGRKSCPLAAPLKPKLVTANGIKEVLDGFELNIFAKSRKPKPSQPSKQYIEYQWEGDGLDIKASETVERMDQPGDRQRRHFFSRKVNILREQN